MSAEAVGRPAERIHAPFPYPGLRDHAPARVRPLFRIWRRPAFDPVASWTLFDALEPSGTRHWVRRIVVGPDAERAARSFGADGLVSEAARAAMLAGLEAAPVTVAVDPDRRVGIDGMSNGVVVFGSFGVEARFEWWQTPPAGWAGLARWWAESCAVCEAVLPRAAIPIQRAHPWVETATG